MILGSCVYYDLYFIKIAANFKIKFVMQEAKTTYREVVLKVVQKILIKARHKAYLRLKFSNLFQNYRSNATSVISIKTLKRRSAVKF